MMRPNAAMLFAIGALVLAGCGGTAEGVAGVAELPSSFTGPGVYTVPAEPGVSFPVAAVNVDVEGSTMAVYYELPTAFFADTPQVRFAGPIDADGTATLSGAAGTSSCSVAATTLTCNEHLSGVRFDQAAALAALQAGNPVENAVASFMAEPIGKLSVDLNTR